MPRQIGVSPKVALPTALLALAGVALLVVALATDDETVRAIALSVLSAAGLGGAAGYAAPAGAVAHDYPPTASDDQLGADAEQRIRTIPPPE